MKLSILASNSRANGYLLHNKREALVIEAGVSLLRVKKALDFRLNIIQGCIVTHRHRDHARYVREYADAGIDVFGPEDIFETHHHRNQPISADKGYKIGNFNIIPFEAHHDVTCFGYMIDHPETGRILFLTDTYLCEYTFPGLNHILIQANYCDDILEENILNGIEHPGKRERLLSSHMEVRTAMAVLMAQDLSEVQNIVLIHLSERNSDEKLFVDQVSAVTGKPVKVAYGGLEINVSKQPF